MKLRNLVPPLFIDILLVLGKSVSGFTGPIEKWQEGLRGGFGYDNPKLHSDDAVDPKSIAGSKVLSSREIRLAFAIQKALREMPKDREIKVLDFGGAGGQHFKLFEKLVGSEKLNYTIVESLPMVQKYEKFSTTNLKWENSIPDGEFDLVLCSASIQYTQQPLEILKKLARLTRFLILDRLSVSDLDSHVLMRQNFWSRSTGRVSYPCWYFADSSLRSSIDEFGEVQGEWLVPEDSPWVFGKRRANIGLLIRSKSEI